MFVLNLNLDDSLENPKFGEIDNYCMDEYDNSLEEYFESFSTFQDEPIYKNFGNIVFAEIKSTYLRDFRGALEDFFGL